MRRLAIALISFNTLLVVAFVWWWVRVYATQQLFLEAALCGLGMFDYPAALANLDARGCDGMTPLMAAARQVSSPAVYYLIDRGANIEATDDEGRTALWWAARAGNYIALEILLRHGADPNKADRRHGITPLIIASRVGHVRIVRMLLEYGVDASKRDRLGQTALDAARRGKHEEHRVIERLLQEYIARQERKKKEDNISHPVT